jgi:uncharacterized protein (TIGR02186 family)
MRLALPLTLCAPLLLLASHACAAEAQRPEQVHSDISTREISIQSNFTGIEIVLFGSIDFSRAPGPDEKPYDVIMVIRGPTEPIIVRRKERVAGIWMNGAAKTYAAVPGFYAALASRPFRAIAPEETLKKLGVGFANVDFGKPVDGQIPDDEFRSALIRIRKDENLFKEADDGVNFIGRSLFRGSVDLPVNVPIGRYTSQVYLFRDGKLLSQSQGSLQVHKVGFERVVYALAFRQPFLYGLLSVLIAMTAGLIAWAVFRKE